MVKKVYKILLAEDSIYTASAEKIILERKNYYVEHIEDGAKVLNALNNTKFDLIILDLMLPNVLGEDLFNEIKKNPNTANIPVIIVTARIDIVNWSENLKKADCLMRKPFDNNDFIKNVEQCLSLKKIS